MHHIEGRASDLLKALALQCKKMKRTPYRLCILWGEDEDGPARAR